MPRVFRDILGSTGTVEDGEFVAYESQEEADKAVTLPERKVRYIEDDNDPAADQLDSREKQQEARQEEQKDHNKDKTEGDAEPKGPAKSTSTKGKADPTN